MLSQLQVAPSAAKAAVYTPTHVKPAPATGPWSTVSATFADGVVPKLLMLLVAPVIEEFRIVGDDDPLTTPKLLVPPVAVAVTLFIDGDDEPLATPWLMLPPVAVAITLFINGDDDEVFCTPSLLSVPPVAVAITLFIDGDDDAPLETP